MLHSSNKQTNQVTAWSRVILGKLIEPLLVKKFPICYGTQRFITILTTAFPCPLLHIPNDTHEVHAVSSCFFNLHLNIIIPFIHRFYKWSLFFRFSNQKSLCSSLFLHTCHMSAHLILLHLITQRVVNYTNFLAPHYVILSSPLFCSWLWFFLVRIKNT